MDLNRRLPRIDNSRFSMVPRQDVPRSTFVTRHSRKSTFDTGYIVPILIDEVIPGDSHHGQCTIFARTLTPVFPIMDRLELETFFFFCPMRLVWANFVKMMGERANPSDSISYTVPRIASTGNGFVANSIFDHFELPTAGGAGAPVNPIEVSVLPLRMYNLIYNEWFRDQNLQNSLAVNTGDTGELEASGQYTLRWRNKKPDYFTGALPWPLKGGVDVTLPLGSNARISGLAMRDTGTVTTPVPAGQETGGITTAAAGWAYYASVQENDFLMRLNTPGSGGAPMVYADLSTATGQTINALRLAFQTQRLLERDARGGTRYTELIYSHYGVDPEDTRLQRPEYIGGGRSSFTTQAIPQTSATGLTGGTSALGSLGAAATLTDTHSYSYHAKEHGYIIGLVNVRGEVTYQNGVHRTWTRQTRYDWYWPSFAHLGEQGIRLDELYATGVDITDASIFAYQERYSEYRHRQSRITGLFRSSTASNIDEWHLAQEFTAAPGFNEAFIRDGTPMARVLQAGAGAANQQILFDSVFQIRSTRPMPMYSVPGMLDRF